MASTLEHVQYYRSLQYDNTDDSMHALIITSRKGVSRHSQFLDLHSRTAAVWKIWKV